MADQVISLKYQGIDRQIKKVRRVQAAVEDPALAPVIRNIAKVWEVNFDAEGSKVGGWRQLAEITQLMRQSRGFNPDHPILVQTGGLRRAAIDALLHADGDTARRENGASMRLSIGKASALLTITGRKVSNQFRERTRGRGGISRPPRRFWFVDDEVKAAAHKGLRDGILDEVRGP